MNRTAAETRECIFCRLAALKEPVSVVYQDTDVVAFMETRPIRPGAFIVIPKVHVDHFSDLSDELCAKVSVTAQRLGRSLPTLFGCDRVGWVVHGYGVAHAHLNVVPQHDPFDITSARFAVVEDGQVRFRASIVRPPDRAELDRQAQSIRVAAGVR